MNFWIEIAKRERPPKAIKISAKLVPFVVIWLTMARPVTIDPKQKNQAIPAMTAMFFLGL